ncbi:MAG: hypothetical protein ACQEVA_22140 [Myxococcota bacterium]
MSLALIRFFAMTVGPAFTAAARPAATFFGVQIVVALLVAYDMASLTPTFSWMISVPALVVAGVLAVMETAAKHDPDIAAVLRDLHVDNMTGAFGAFTAALLFAALGMPESEAAGLIEGGSTLPEPGAGDVGENASGVLGATATAATAEHNPAVQVGAVGGALGINLGLTWLRSELLEFIDDFDLGTLWARLETGGVIGVLVLLPLLPLIVFAFILVFGIVLGSAAWASKKAMDYIDQRSRVECASCGYEVREEASLCPECGAERQPKLTHESGVGAAWDALFDRGDAETRPALES